MNRLGVFTSACALGWFLAYAGGCAAGTAPYAAPIADAAVDSKVTTRPDSGGVDSKLPITPDAMTEEDTSLPTERPTPSTAPTYDPGAKTKPTGAGTTYDDTVGKPCSSDTSCDILGAGSSICAKGAFSGDSLYPTPVCVGPSCDAGDGTTIKYCDGINGVCLSTSSGGICLPGCDFDATSGYKPYGCAGRNVCNVYGWGTDSTSGKVIGVGYCFGGCFDDTDCPSGEKCQREDGLCKATLDAWTRPIGSACSKGDTDCNCLYANSTSKGYCTAFCRMGETGWCPGGYTCDAMLPKTDDTGAVLFTKAPATIAGNCLKNCTTDADCTAINGYCKEMAGTGKKTCQIGTP